MKILFCFSLVILIVTYVNCGLIRRIFHLDTTSTTTPAPTTPAVPAEPYVTSNNVPKVEADCEIIYTCSRKLKVDWPERPCVKFCVKNIECPNEKEKRRGKPNECFELNHALVLAEHEKEIAQGTTTVAPLSTDGPTTKKPMQVAMIDFPCQPGYLPDHRGRCREVW